MKRILAITLAPVMLLAALTGCMDSRILREKKESKIPLANASPLL